jgi:hypothetical protein
MAVTIRVRRGTATQWAARTTPLLTGEFGYDTTNKIIKIGDGTSLWNTLQPINSVNTTEIGEIAQDAIYDALTNFIGIGNNITVSYNDADNYIVLDTGPSVVLQADLTNAINGANDYTDIAIASFGDTVENGYIPIGEKANAGGVASLGLDGYVPDSQISPDIARDSEIITSYNDLTDKPAIALGAVQWTANHYQLEGGANTRYLAGDIVWDGGNIYVANFDNESLPTTNTQYWSLVGPGNRLNIDGRDIPNIIWDNILEKPTLFDGDYNTLTNKPTIPSDVSDLTDSTSILVPFNSPTFTGTVTTSDLIINGDVTINGGDFLASATQIVIEDSLLQLGHTNPANTVDLGIVVSYNDGTQKHAGLVKDASDSKWKLFKDVETEPTTTVDFTEALLDDLQLNDLSVASATIGDVSNTEIQYLNGVTDSIQTQLDAKLGTDAAGIIYLGKIEAGFTYAPKNNPTFTGTVTFPENTSGANLINIPSSALPIATTNSYGLVKGRTTEGQAPFYTTALGSMAAYDLTTGMSNVAIGHQALRIATTAAYNTVVGTNSGQSLTSGTGNVFIGVSAGSNGNSSDNVGVGNNALMSVTGIQNTGIGNGAGYTLTSGNNNIIIGNDALSSSITVSNEITLGNSNITKLRVPGLSINWSLADVPTKISAATSTVLGTVYGRYIESGLSQSVGLEALNLNTTGTFNAAFGSHALRYNTEGESNSAFGIKSLENNQTGNNNTAVGSNALSFNSTGGANTAVGGFALQNNLTGLWNTGIGVNALYQNTTGIQNTAIGSSSLSSATGNKNTAIGYKAGYSGNINLTTGSNNILIGYNSEPSSATVSNEITLGDSGITRFRIPGLGIDWTITNVPTSGGGGSTGADIMNIMEAW